MSNVEYLDAYNYAKILAPEVQSEGVDKKDVESIIDKYNFNDVLKSELLEDIQEYIQEETKNFQLEFIARFFERLGKGSKTSFAVARALGFHIYLKDKNGNELHTMKDIARHWNICPQALDLIVKEVAKDIEIQPIKNLAIHKKNYSYKVESPKGYYTTSEVMKFLNLTNKKLNGIIRKLDIKKKDYVRGSKLISDESVDAIERYLMDGK